MSRTDFFAGLVPFALLLALTLFAGRQAVHPGAPPVERGLAWALGTAGAVIAAHALPLALGVLRMTTVVVAAAIVAGVAVLVRRRWPPPRVDPRPLDLGPARRSPLALLAVGVVSVAALALLAERVGEPPLRIDALSFHLPVVVRWMQTGSLWQLDQFLPGFSNATYPEHGDLLMLATVLPWSSIAFAEYAAVPSWIGTGFAVAALARHLGAPAPTAVLAGAAVLALPVVAIPGLEAVQTDAPLLLCGTAGVLFALRGRPGLAILGLGLAFGTKWYGVSSVPVILVLLALFGRPPARTMVLGALGVAAVGGLWLLRNWVETGNPIYPVAVPGLFDAPPDRFRTLAGFSLLDYAGQPAIWRDYFIEAFAISFGWAGPVLVGAAAVGAALARDRLRIGVAVGGALLALVYTATPYTAFGGAGMPVLTAANTRYGVPALIAAAVLGAWAIGRLRPRPLVWAAHLALLLGLLDAVGRWTDGIGTQAWTPALAGAVAGAVLWRVGRRLPRVALTLGGGTALLAAGVIAAKPIAYAPYEPTMAWLEANAASGARVGIAGDWTLGGILPPLPAHGPRLGNEAEYVGPFVEGTLQQYRDERAFRAALRRGHYDVLILGLGDPPRPRSREESWAAREGYVRMAASPRLAALARFRPTPEVPSLDP